MTHMLHSGKIVAQLSYWFRYLPDICITNSACYAAGSEAAGQGIQESRQREEMQRTVRDSS